MVVVLVGTASRDLELPVGVVLGSRRGLVPSRHRWFESNDPIRRAHKSSHIWHIDTP